MGQPRPLFRSFLIFYKQTSLQFILQINVKKYHVHPVYSAGIRTHTLSNMNHPPLPLDHGSRHYTTYLIHELVINKRQSENFITTLKMSLKFTRLFYLLIFYANVPNAQVDPWRYKMSIHFPFVSMQHFENHFLIKSRQEFDFKTSFESSWCYYIIIKNGQLPVSFSFFRLFYKQLIIVQ